MKKIIPDWPHMLWLVTAIPWVSVVSLDTYLVTTIATGCPLLCNLDTLF